MADLQLVLPNLFRFKQRGGPAARADLAQKLGFQAVEVPADLIKSVRESARTSRPIGDIPGDEDLPLLYEWGTPAYSYILHTDPGIPRRGPDGLVIPELRWKDRTWTERYAAFLASTASFLGSNLLAVELHSGRGAATADSIVQAMGLVSEAMRSRLGRPLSILMENKQGQMMATADDLIDLWDRLGGQGRFGLVVDLPNLWKARRSHYLEDLRSIPEEAIWGFHLHWKHRAPGPQDPISWGSVMSFVRELEGPRFVNPEVFHLSELEKAIGFLGLKPIEGPA